MPAPSPDLLELARLHGVQPGYRDAWGAGRKVSGEALAAVLAALGAPLSDGDGAGVAAALAARRAALAERIAEPVAVVWDGRELILPLRLPPGTGRFVCHLDLEGRGRRRAEIDASRLAPGTEPGTSLLPVAERFPIGYHKLTVEAGDRRAE